MKNKSLNWLLISFFSFFVAAFPSSTLPIRIAKILFAFLGFFYILIKGNFKSNGYVKWLVLISFLSAISIIWSIDRNYAINGTITIILNSVCLIIFCQLVNGEKSWLVVTLKSFVFGAIVRFIPVILVYGSSIFLGLRNTAYSAYNSLGMVCALAGAFSLFLVVVFKQSPFFLLLFPLFMFMVILSSSRKAILYLLLPIIMFLFIKLLLKAKTTSKRILYVCIFFLFIFAGYFVLKNVPFLHNGFGGKILEIIDAIMIKGKDESMSGRFARIDFGISLFLSKPILGYGSMNYNYMFGIVEPSTDLLVADNNYIDILVNFGLFGFVIYYGYYLIIFIKNFRYKSHLYLRAFNISLLFALMICELGTSAYLYLHSQLMIGILFLTTEYMKKEALSKIG